MKIFKLTLILTLLVFCFTSTTAQVRDGSYKATKSNDPTEIVTITATSLGNGQIFYATATDKTPLEGSYHFEIHGSRRHIEAKFSKGLPQGEWIEYMYSDIYRKYNFKDGQYHGNNYLYYGDGSHRRVSKYKEGILQHDISYFEDGELEEEVFYDKDGKKHGKVVTYFEDGEVSEIANYEHGVLHGTQKKEDENGFKVLKTYNQGNLEGLYLRTYPNGKKQEEGVYDANHKKEGKWTVWYKNGNVKTITHYQNGKLHGEKQTFHEFGNPYLSEEYANDILNGKKIIYDENTPNLIITEMIYANGKLDGESKSYHEGKLWRESFYKEGKMLREKEYKNEKLNVLRLIDDNGRMVDVQQYDATGKITNRNKSYKKPVSIQLKEDASGIIDIEIE